LVQKEQSKNPFEGLQLWKVVDVFALVFAAVLNKHGVESLYLRTKI
jgi:hypothetical protein